MFLLIQLSKKELVIPNSVQEMERNVFLKNDTSNPNLTTIYNNTGKSFDWGTIVGGNYNPETGIVENSLGNVEIKKSN